MRSFESAHLRLFTHGPPMTAVVDQMIPAALSFLFWLQLAVFYISFFNMV